VLPVSSLYAKLLAKRVVLKKKKLQGKRIRLFRVEKSHLLVGCIAENGAYWPVGILVV
jgi:hypothetical protein